MKATEHNIANRLGISEGELEIVITLLGRYVPGRPVWAFGSRTFGRARRRSDLDLAIGGSCSLSVLTRIDLAEAFDQSDLPIEVDVVDLNDVTPEFRKRIAPDFVAIQASEETAPSGRELAHVAA